MEGRVGRCLGMGVRSYRAHYDDGDDRVDDCSCQRMGAAKCGVL